MRDLDPLFLAHLQSGATTLATCWRIARADGEVFRFTDHDRALVMAGETYEPESGGEGSAIQASADLSVDNCEVAGLLSSARLSAAELDSGRFDGAAVEIWRVNWQAPDQRLLVKTGRIGEVRREGARFTAEIRGFSAALDAARGRVYQRLCDADLGDARCGVDLDAPSYRAAGAVLAVADEARFTAAGLEAFPENWFALGRLDWTAGANAGTRAHVRSQAGGVVALFAPAGRGLAPGDLFEIRAGCDKAHATCRDKFANAVNFRGFHLMPGDDFAVSYPLRSGTNDGGRR
jgi:uncharacterized phage protein (TIGR02218 family)